MKQEEHKKIDAAFQALALEGNAEYRFDLKQICQIHDQMIELYGGQPGVRDNNLLESVADAPYQELFGKTLFPTIFDKAAKYLFDFSKYQVFYDGNKRTGLGVCQAFLHVHGFDFKDDFGTTAYLLVMDIANHKYIEPQEIIDIIKDNVVINPEMIQARVENNNTYNGNIDIETADCGIINYSAILNGMQQEAKDQENDSPEIDPADPEI